MKERISEEYVRQLVSMNLRRLRNLQNLSQMSLALGAGVAHNFINDVENCKKGISVKTLAKLSAALNVEPYQFFLPDNMSDDTVNLYVYDFNDSLQKMVKDLTAQYVSAKGALKPS